MNTMRFWKGVASSVMFLGGLLIGHHAYAISVAGSSGYPVATMDNPFGKCFTAQGSQIQYTGSCGALQTWTIPLPTNSGTRSVAISGTNNSTLNCSLCATDQTGRFPICSGVPAFPTSTTSVQTASVTVPASGGMYVACDVGPNSLINTLNYNQ